MKRFSLFFLLLGLACPVGMCANAPLPAGRQAPSTGVTGTVPGMGGKELCKQNFDEYRERIRTHPEDTQVWQELRVCADLLKRWGEAGAIAQGAIDHGVQRWEPHLLLGLAHYHTKDYNAAVDDFKESIRLKDDQAITYFQLGLAYLHLNQPSDAVGAGVRAAELDPYNPAYHHQLAFSYFMIHEDEKSEAEAKKAIEIDKNDVAAYKILSNLYAKEGKQELADQMMEESIHANGRQAQANPFVPDKKLTEADMPHPFEVSTQPSDIEVFLKAQWEKMKQAGLKSDIEATASFYSSEGGTRDIYRNSFQRMGSEHMHDVFSKLGELSDCEISSTASSATCRCPVNGGSGTMLETRVYFEKNPDHIWRIKAF